jgi:alpha-tubulin suppressor-like RCC1 family protein
MTESLSQVPLLNGTTRIIDVIVSDSSVFVQTTQSTTECELDHRAEDCKIWVWGSNAYGKLGSNALQGGPVPALLPRSSFPNVYQAEYGNEIGGNLGNNVLSYEVWTGAGITSFEIFLSNGTKGLLRIAAEINELIALNGHDRNVVMLTSNVKTERASLKLTRPGYRLILSQGLSHVLGFYSSKFPASGVVNEVSARMRNNVIIYRVWVPTQSFNLQNSFFYFRAWSNTIQASDRFQIQIPDGLYTLSSLVSLLNQEVSNMQVTKALNIQSFDFGGGDVAASTLYDSGIIIEFDLPNGVGEFMGFPREKFPPNTTFGGVGVPNEISSAADTGIFQYRTQRGVFNVTFPSGVYSVDQVQNMIEFGLSKNGHDPHTFSFLVGQDDRVVLLILKPGYQVVFDTVNNIRQYLGFVDMDIPCNPAHTVPNLTEDAVGSDRSAVKRPFCIGRFAAPNASMAVQCKNSSRALAGLMCGLTVSGTFVKRAYHMRPLLTNFSASGVCRFLNGSASTAVCGCSANGTLRVCVSLDESSWTLEGLNTGRDRAYNFSSCLCTKKPFSWQEFAIRKWGIVAQRSLIIPDGVYSHNPIGGTGSPTRDLLSEISAAITTDLQHNNISGQVSVSALLMSSSVQYSFRVYGSETTVGIQLLFSSSSVSSVLGLGENNTLPHDHFMTQNDEPTQNGNFLNVLVDATLPYFSNTYSEEANVTGEWVYKIAAGRLHTVVLTKHPNNGRYCSGNVNVGSGCGCFRTRLWSFGSNKFGQLGTSENIGTDRDNPDPILIHFANAFRPECIVTVYAGGYHTAVLEQLSGGSNVWMFGSNSFGQVGRQPSIMEPAFRISPLISGLNFLANFSMFLGPHHTILLQSARVWVFGKSFNDTNSAITIELSITSAVHEKQANFTWVLGCTGNSFVILQGNDRSLWSFGDNLYGQLGQSNYYTVPYQLYRVGEGMTINLTKEMVSTFACGGDHVVVLSADGTVWTFGKNLYGQLMQDTNVGLNNQNFQPSAVDPSLFSSNSGGLSTPVINVWAAGDFSFAQTGRMLCGSGFKSSDGLQPCVPCNAGTFSIGNRSTHCDSCVYGKYSLLGASSCMHCPFGTYSNVQKGSVCSSCPAGRNGTKGTASISVDNCTAVCPAGQYGVFGVIPCTPCSRGYFASAAASSLCQPCPMGQYQPSTNQTFCFQCSQNKSTSGPGSMESTVCLSICTAGYFGVNGLANCSACPLGKYADSLRSSTCQLCPIDTYGNRSGLALCYECPYKTGTNNTGQSKSSSCVAWCIPGQYSSNGLAPCKTCSAGNISRSFRSTACIRCAGATYPCDYSSDCCACPSGTYLNSYLKSNGTFSCQSCPPGSYSELNNSTICVLCERGTFSSSLSSTTCIFCSVLFNISTYGTVSIGSTNATACQNLCPEGYFSATGLPPCKTCDPGFVSYSGAFSCISCSSGKYSSSASADCMSCENGSYSFDNSSQCTFCPEGSISAPSPSSNTGCIQCAPGTYASAVGQSVCTECNANDFSSGHGASMCIACSPGKYQTATGQSLCKDCSPGTFNDPVVDGPGCVDCSPGSYQNIPGQTQCMLCAAGSFTTENRSRACWNCDAGNFQDLEGQISCKPCEAGKFSSDNMSHCLSCPFGSFSNPSASFCAYCPKGFNTSKIGSAGVSDCRRVCIEGEFGPSFGIANESGGCEFCSAGTYSSSSYFTSCTDCPLGTFSSANMSSCKVCESGAFSSVLGSTECNPCIKGYFQDQTGFSFCFSCLAGTFSAVNQSIRCENCSEGLFTFKLGSTVCSRCIPGKYAVESGCLNCSSGHISDGLGSCTSCPAGTFSDQDASSVCISCAGGKSTAQDKSNSSNDCVAVCPPGFFGRMLGVNATYDPCRVCAIGTYNRFRHQSACQACPRGTFSNSSGSTSCSSCPSGFFADKDNQTSCSQCPNTAFPFNQATETLTVGASSAADCRTLEYGACESSPRHFGVYPVYTVGRNQYGESIEDSFYSNTPDSAKNIHPYLITCDQLGYSEIHMFETSGDHSFFQSVRKGFDGSKDFILWSVGKNWHGQLGSKENAGTDNMNSRPIMVPRALFPNTKCGNAISKFCKNNLFFYWNWNSQKNTEVFFNLTIDDGVYGPNDLALHVADKAKDVYGHTEPFFQTEISKDSQRVVILIAVPGFQIDFTLQGSVKDSLGFDHVKVPAQSTLNEVSERAGNIFSYRIWCQASEGSPCTSFRTVNTVLPDGIYDLDQLNKEIQETSMRDGTDMIFAKSETRFPSIDASDSFDISWQPIRFDMIADKVEMSISGPGIQVLFNSPDNLASLLGFEEINYPPLGPTNASETHYRAHKARGYLNSGQRFEPFRQESSNSGQIIVAFSLGADYTLIQTTDEAANKSRLWGIGSNKHGQLGSYYGAGTDQINWVPVLVQAFDQMNGGQEAAMFKAGGSHTLVTDKTGNLWVFGSNEYGQLGRNVNSGTQNANFEPKKLIISDNRPAANEISAEAGNNRFEIECSNLSFGLNLTEGIYSEDDLNDIENQLNDGICRSVFGCHLVKVKLGITNENKLVFRLISPSEGYCQINFYNLETARMFGFVSQNLRPACTKNMSFCDYQADNFSPLFFNGRNQISSISLGKYHSLVLTENSYSGKRILWAWGSNMYGQLGTTAKLCNYADGFYRPCEDGSSYISSPLKLDEFLFLNRKIVSFSAGGYHSIVQDSSNALWCFGWNRYGQCGYPLPILATLELANPLPMLISSHFLSTGTTQLLNYSMRASTFVGGLTFTLFGTENGLMSVGSNSFGQLIRSTNNLGKENPNFESGKIDAVGNDDQPVIGFVAGSFQSFVQTFRPYCDPGYFSIDGRSPCAICEAGSYAALAGSRIYSSISWDQSMIHPYFSGAEVVLMNVNTTLSCVACPAGTFSKNGSLNCSACGVGKYSFHGASQCHLCPPGTYGGEASASVCGLCEPGKSSLVGQSDCSSCLPGLYAGSAGSSSCAQCNLGSFALSSNTVLCEPCDAGFYQNASGQTMCVICPESLTTGQKGSKFLNECLALCKAGQEGESLYPNGPALKNCRDCVKGTYSFNPNTVNGFGATSCLPCGAGKYSPAGASECSNCSAGTFGSNTNATSCLLCEAGTYSSQLASTYCKDCVAGLSSIFNSSSCAVCPAGSFSTGKSKNCSDCGPGRYSAYDGSPNCLICSAGSFNSISRSSSCSVCLGGTFASGWGLSACILCNPGSVSSTNATTCQECLPGTYAGWFGQSTCSLCEIAKYQSQLNSTACMACPEGKQTQGPINILDARCALGPRICDIPELHLSRDNCVPLCKPGYFSFWGTLPCLECPAGYFNTKNASTYCLACSAGEYSFTWPLVLFCL